MAIIATAGGSIAVGLIKKANEQNVISDMLLIQTQVNIIMERAAFSGDSSNYIGIKLKNVSNKNEVAGESLTNEELEKDTIYVYNKQILDSLGLSKITTSNIFLVDYSNGDVIIPQGCKKEDGTMLYRLSQTGNNLISYENTNTNIVTFESGKDYIQAEVFANNLGKDITDYQFLIATTEEGVKNKTSTWIKESKNKFTDLLPNSNYYIMIKTKTSSGTEQTSKVYRVRTQENDP